MQCSRVPASYPSTLFTALAHTLQGSVLLHLRDSPESVGQILRPIGHDQRAGAIENA